MALVARVEGVGLLGPGLSGWEAARAILAGREAYVPAPTVIPAPEALPAVERRRAGKSVKLALAAGLAAAADAKREARELTAVFASSTGDGDNLHAICNAALEGMGACIVSAWMVKEHIESGRLVELLPEWRASALPVTVNYPYARHYPARLRLFIDLMKEVMPAAVGDEQRGLGSSHAWYMGAPALRASVTGWPAP